MAKKGSKAKDAVELARPPQPSGPTEKEEKLEKELLKLDEELRSLKSEAEDLRRDNDFLQQEAQQTKQEMNEYLSYIEKRTKRRQGQIFSLNDKNAADLTEIYQNRDQLLKEYEDKRQGLKKILLSKEKQLQEIQGELLKLDEFRELKEQQEREIAALERQVKDLRAKQTRDIERLKIKFLDEKKTFSDQCEIQMQQLAEETSKEAKLCLQKHASNVSTENQQLKRELLRLIQHTHELQSHKEELRKQQAALKYERDFARDLQKIRQHRTSRLYKTFAVHDADHNHSQR